MFKNFQIHLEISDENFAISNFDIDFFIKKSSDVNPNFAKIFVWNLDDNLHQKFAQTSSDISIIYQNDVYEYAIFCGKIEKCKTKKNIVKSSSECEDTLSEFYLVNSKSEIDNSVFNRMYRDKISTTRILEDCAKFMGLTAKTDSDNIPFIEFPYLKIYGKTYSIISNICKNLSLDFSIENGVLEVFPTTLEDKEADYKFTQNNSILFPFGNGNFEIKTEFLPTISFSDLIECDYDILQGVFRPREIEIVGNNYKKFIENFIRIG